MKSLKLILLFSLISFAKSEARLSIQVYYESLCPDSIAFITKQLFPTYQKLGKYLSVEFKPFGNAKFFPTDQGGWNFACQHGNNECIGNLYQVCLLDKTRQNNELQVNAINCIMSSKQPDLATAKCMADLEINDPSYSAVEKCQSSIEGQNLLHGFGVETNLLEPPHYFIPWITFDKVWSESEFEAALADLKGFLCNSKLADVPECQD